MSRFLPNTAVFEAGEFFPGAAVDDPLVTENFARAMFTLAEGATDVRGAAKELAGKMFAAHRAEAVSAPTFPDALLLPDLVLGGADADALWLLLAVGKETPSRVIFGILSDACPNV